MPALEVVSPFSSAMEFKKKSSKQQSDTPEKKKKSKKTITTEEEEEEDQVVTGFERGTSKRKLSKGSEEEEPSSKRSKKKKKKSWDSDVEEEEKGKTGAATALTSEGDDDEEKGEIEGEEEENPNAVSNFNISKVLREKLKTKGIESLFPIQAMTFQTIFEGFDMVGRARTGQGKTLAFVLPIVESLTSGRHAKDRSKAYGRAPSVIVLVPTRELAKQVHADFEVYGGAVGLSTCAVYGGAPYGPQEHALRRGVDVVVGTPGRIKDHIERSTLNLKSLKFRVLDEADEMLNMGFVEDVENILGKVEDVSKVQTLLFSATMPNWVKQIAARFFKPDRKTADLVGDDKMKASRSVRHIVLPCFYKARAKVIPDVIRCYSSGGQTIVFTETKNDASELAGTLSGQARALHGDIQQSQREVTLSGFRSGKFSILVATDVAARGLDINDVQLIIQCEPPRDVETYIHRSGRTGRAGNTGVSVMLYDRKKQYMISQIEMKAGVKFERASAPQPADVARAAGQTAAESIMSVTDSVLPVFRQSAEQLLKNGGVTPVDIIAKALAKIAGYTEVKKRSLLSSQEDTVTLMLRVGKVMYTPSYAFTVLKRIIPEEKISGISGMSLTADGTGAVFDVPSQDADLYLAGQENAEGVDIEVPNSLPELQVRNDQPRGNGYSRGGRGGNSNGKSWGGARGGGGGSRRGGGGGGSRGGGWKQQQKRW
uniref:RNA helicase n=1 Tax=Araucaria cunninghamii TaxID=56994 RepID=A0A0D6QTU2_ARACU